MLGREFVSKMSKKERKLAGNVNAQIGLKVGVGTGTHQGRRAGVAPR